MTPAVGDPRFRIMEVQRAFPDSGISGSGQAEPSSKSSCQRANVKQLGKFAVTS
jgi:hypothetical protein